MALDFDNPNMHFTLIFEMDTIIELLDGLIPRRGLPVGDVFTSLAINHVIDRETLNMFSKWYQDTALDDFTKIPAKKMNLEQGRLIKSMFLRRSRRRLLKS